MSFRIPTESSHVFVTEFYLKIGMDIVELTILTVISSHRDSRRTKEMDITAENADFGSKKLIFTLTEEP